MKDKVTELLEQARRQAQDNDKVGGCIVLLKIDGNYVRYSTTMEDIANEIGQLEMLKSDIINRTR